jgi:hypothetical protein
MEENPPKLILNALIDCDTDRNRIYLAMTGRDQVSSVDNPLINILINGELKEQLNDDTRENDASSYLPDMYTWTNPYTTGVKFSPGDRVKIEASDGNGQRRAWAEDVVPQPVRIERVDTMTYTKKIWFGEEYRYLRVKITFTDNPDEKNYYRLALQSSDTLYGLSHITGKDTVLTLENYPKPIINEDFVLTGGRPYLDENDAPLFQPENPFCIFDDTHLNGTYTMTVSWRMDYYFDYYISEIMRRLGSLTIRLSAITESQYYYLKAVGLSEYETGKDFLYQPIPFPSNVQGGTGILGLSATSEQTLYLTEN